MTRRGRVGSGLRPIDGKINSAGINLGRFRLAKYPDPKTKSADGCILPALFVCNGRSVNANIVLYYSVENYEF